MKYIALRKNGGGAVMRLELDKVGKSTVTSMACVDVSLSVINLPKEGSLNGRHSI